MLAAEQFVEKVYFLYFTRCAKTPSTDGCNPSGLLFFLDSSFFSSEKKEEYRPPLSEKQKESAFVSDC